MAGCLLKLAGDRQSTDGSTSDVTTAYPQKRNRPDANTSGAIRVAVAASCNVAVLRRAINACRRSTQTVETERKVHAP